MSTIASYDIYTVPPRFLFLRLETDDEIVGWGEAMVGGFSSAVREVINLLIQTQIRNEDPTKIKHHWQKMYYGGFHHGGPILMSAISAIDQCLWDITGKIENTPVYGLLGGRVREKVQVYQSIGGDQPLNLVETAHEAIDNGFRAIKVNIPSAIRTIDTMSKVRQIEHQLTELHNEIDSEVSIAVDLHGRAPKHMLASILSSLESCDPLFVEEPLHPENMEYQPGLASLSTVPIAAGGRMYTQGQFKRLVSQQLSDIVQARVTHAGGITSLNEIANVADSAGMPIAPHHPYGPISFASSLHLAHCVPNLHLLQQPLGVHERRENMFNKVINTAAFEYSDGFSKVNNAPGLGVELDQEFLEAQPSGDVDFTFPVWRNSDGSISKW